MLNKISLSIAAGQKVAVCGRTGSGKSSLILLLLRLLDPVDTTRSQGESARPWKFTIDGVSIGDVDRTTLRQRLIAVPQECVFLPEGSSIKENVDLSGTFSDAECLAVLDKVQLSSFVEERGGLDATMSASQMSAGQKQLLSMGRAILRKQARERHLGIGRGSRTSAGAAVDGGILLLDEVSSSVDDATDRRMHDLIREQFASYTVIMVAHRLDSLVDYVDSVVVLDKGRVVETGPPKELLTRDDGWFRRLVKP